jgi:hypothetical protein
MRLHTYRVYDIERHKRYTFTVWVGEHRITPRLRSYRLACAVHRALVPAAIFADIRLYGKEHGTKPHT